MSPLLSHLEGLTETVPSPSVPAQHSSAAIHPQQHTSCLSCQAVPISREGYDTFPHTSWLTGISLIITWLHIPEGWTTFSAPLFSRSQYKTFLVHKQFISFINAHFNIFGTLQVFPVTNVNYFQHFLPLFSHRSDFSKNDGLN